MARQSIFILFWLAFIAMPADAQEATVSEALALEIEELATTGRLRIRGTEVASGELLVDVYEQNRFELTWTRPEQIGELLEAIRATESDGLNPADYHVEEVQAGYQQLLSGVEITANERADLDLLFTDSLIRLGYHERFGKLNPHTLDPQWNFRREKSEVDAAAAILAAIDSTSLLAHLQTQFPRGVFYQQMRQGLARLDNAVH